MYAKYDFSREKLSSMSRYEHSSSAISVLSCSEVELSKVLTIAEEIVLLGLHLHLGVGELDVVLVVSDIGQKNLVIDNSNSLLDEIDLSDGTVRAFSDVRIQSREFMGQANNTFDKVVVITLHEDESIFLKAHEKFVLGRNAGGEIISGLLSSELVDHSCDVASNLLAGVGLLVGKRFPGEVADLLLRGWEKSIGEGFTSSGVLSVSPKGSHLAVGGVDVHAELHGVDVHKAIELGGPVVRMVDICVQFVVLGNNVDHALGSTDEHLCIITVLKLLDGDGLRPVDDLFAHLKLLQIE